MFNFKHAKKSIDIIEQFLGLIDQGSLIFKDGVKNYLLGNKENFQDNLKTLSNLSSEADIKKREIENILYTQSLMPQLRGDILKLLEELNNIIDLAKTNLFEFDVEVPFIPSELNQDLIKLTELSVLAIDSLIPAARDYFVNPDSVKEKLHRVYLYEKETDKLASSIKRRVFQNIPQLKLSEKIHLRYFTLHIEILSDVAKNAADLLSIMALKRAI